MLAGTVEVCAAQPAVLGILELRRIQRRHPIHPASPDWNTSQEFGAATPTQSSLLTVSLANFSGLFCLLLKSPLIESHCDLFCGFLPEHTLQSEVRIGLENSSRICLGKVGFRPTFSSELLQLSELRWAGRKQCFISFWEKKKWKSNEWTTYVLIGYLITSEFSCIIFSSKRTLSEAEPGGAYL